MADANVIKVILDFVNNSGSTINQAVAGFSSLQTGLIGAASAYGVFRAVDIVGDLAKIGAEAEEVGTAFKNLAGGDSGFLSQLRQGFSGTASDIDIMRAANKAMLLELPVTKQEMVFLANAAERLGDAVNKGAGEAFEILTRGLATGNKRALKDLGLELTDIGNIPLSLKEIGSTVNRLGPDFDSASDKIDRFNASWENFKTKAGGSLAGPVGKVLDVGSFFLSGASIEDEIKNLKMRGEAFERMGKDTTQIEQQILELYKQKNGALEETEKRIRTIYSLQGDALKQAMGAFVGAGTVGLMGGTAYSSSWMEKAKRDQDALERIMSGISGTGEKSRAEQLKDETAELEKQTKLALSLAQTEQQRTDILSKSKEAKNRLDTEFSPTKDLQDAADDARVNRNPRRVLDRFKRDSFFKQGLPITMDESMTGLASNSPYGLKDLRASASRINAAGPLFTPPDARNIAESTMKQFGQGLAGKDDSKEKLASLNKLKDTSKKQNDDEKKVLDLISNQLKTAGELMVKGGDATKAAVDKIWQEIAKIYAAIAAAGSVK